MPELPEVETVRRTLAPHLLNRRLTGLRLQQFPGVIGEASPAEFLSRIQGREVVALDRRAKYLLLHLDDDATLMVHLRMTGHLTVVPRERELLRFEHVAIELDNEHDLRFADQRKFGRVLLWLPADVAALDQRLGPEPLSDAFSPAVLATALARRPGKLKSVLLDQKLVAGLGNIYVDEASFLARLHPERAANSLDMAAIVQLHAAIQAVLNESIARSGTTFSSFADADGKQGGYGEQLSVYGQGGKGVCPRCGGPLHRTVVGGRGTHFCPVCQPAPGAVTRPPI